MNFSIRFCTLTLAFLFSVAVTLTAQSGFIDKTFTDASRSNRSVPTRIYYPSVSTGQNAPITAVGNFPVVVFAHGRTMYATEYGTWSTQLAAQGYIIVQVGTETGGYPSVPSFSADMLFMIQAMKTEKLDANSLFFNRLNGRFAVGGHSTGGAASFFAAANNPNISAVFNFAAANVNPLAQQTPPTDEAAKVSCPTLIIGGQSDCFTPSSSNGQPLYTATAAACKYFIEIAGGSHCKYSDVSSGCSTSEFCVGSVTAASQQATVNTYLTPFLDYHLKLQTARLTDFQTAYTTGTGLSAKQGTATCVAIIPVELTQFFGKKQEKSVQLTWQTASERNNRGFDIERSDDGKTFEKVGFVKGNGSTQTPLYFSFLDDSPLWGSGGKGAYYRLKQWDFDGEFTFSKTIFVENKGQNTVKISPNPVGTEGVLLLENLDIDATSTRIEVINSVGQVVKKSASTNRLDVGNLPQGIYFLKIKTAANEQILRFVKA